MLTAYNASQDYRVFLNLCARIEFIFKIQCYFKTLRNVLDLRQNTLYIIKYIAILYEK